VKIILKSSEKINIININVVLIITMAKEFKDLTNKKGFWFVDTHKGINEKNKLCMIYLPIKAVRNCGLGKETKIKITVEILEEE
jgi:hypothetical protein